MNNEIKIGDICSFKEHCIVKIIGEYEYDDNYFEAIILRSLLQSTRYKVGDHPTPRKDLLRKIINCQDYLKDINYV